MSVSLLVFSLACSKGFAKFGLTVCTHLAVGTSAGYLGAGVVISRLTAYTVYAALSAAGVPLFLSVHRAAGLQYYCLYVV